MAEQADQKQQVIPAVFGSKEQAEAAIADLRKHGFSDDDIGIAVPQPGKYALPDEEEAGETWKGFVKGAALGAPIGALAGFALFSLVVPGGAAVGLGGALLFALRDGALWGAALGGGLGLYSKIRWNPEEDRWCEIQLGGNDVLVVVRAGQRLEEARHILERHGARCFLDAAKRVELATGAGSPDDHRDSDHEQQPEGGRQ